MLFDIILTASLTFFVFKTSIVFNLCEPIRCAPSSEKVNEFLASVLNIFLLLLAMLPTTVLQREKILNNYVY